MEDTVCVSGSWSIQPPTLTAMQLTSSFRDIYNKAGETNRLQR
jgi:hypothetical protein